MEPELNLAKLKELMLYVAHQCQGDPTFGATKLNKILYFSDFWAYGLLGSPITGATYQVLRFGPAPRSLPVAQQALLDAREAVMAESDRFGYKQKRLVPLRDPELAGFSADEISIVDQVVVLLRGKTAADTSMLSHMELGWQIAAEGDDIPYQSMFLSNQAPTPDDTRRAQQLAAEHGWLAHV